MNRTPLYVILGLIAVIGLTAVYFTLPNQRQELRSEPPAVNEPTNVEPSPSPITDLPKTVTLEGEYTCIPHKDTSEPQTMECALGIKATDGQYYSLDTQELGSNPIMDLATGSRLQVEGILVPLEALSTDHWRIYNMRGIIRVTSLKKL